MTRPNLRRLGESSVLAGLRGPAREAQWRRRRLRRIAAVSLAALAVLLVVQAVRPAPARTRPILVAAHPVAAGATLRDGDLREVDWPAAARLPDPLSRGQARGQVTAGALTAGEPVLAGRLLRTRSLPVGERAVVVPLADPAVAAVVQAGDHVDVFDGSGGPPVAVAAPVLSSLATRDAAGTSAQQPAVVLRVPATSAGRVARAVSQARSSGGALDLAVVGRG